MAQMTTWKKACDCANTTATSGQIRLSPLPPDATGFRVNFTMIPNLSCDTCGKAWLREDHDPPTEAERTT